MASRPNAFEPAAVVREVRAALDAGDRYKALARLAGVVREGDAPETRSRVEEMAARLEADPETARRIGDALRGLLVLLRVGPALTESGVASAAGFATELSGRLVRRLLPDLDEEGDLRTAIRRLFVGRDDHRRIESVPDAVWIRLLDALGIADPVARRVDPELAGAIRTLTQHVGSLGMQPEFTRRLPRLEHPDSPFLALTDRVLAYLRSYTDDVQGDHAALLAQALETIGHCRAEVEHLRATKGEHGTSLHLTGITFRLLQLLDRLELLLHVTDPEQHDFRTSAVRLFREIVVAEKTRNEVTPLLRAHADLLAFQVVEHAARKGSKYITTGRSDYWGFFLASLGGGAIVAAFSFLKTIIGGWSLPLGVEAVLYGLNYSACFVLIYLTGSVLATKQPAMTANTIARALGDPQARHMEELERLVVRVWRSQFVSFVGNLAMALPMALLISEVFLRSTGATVMDAGKAAAMMEGLHPWRSGTVVFAAIAGVFLFLAGLLSGWVDNRNLYSRVPERVARHPVLARIVGPRGARRLADFLDRNLGILAGNVFLGFALGSTGTVGEILGLPLDIRHIAFASAEFGTALEVLHFDVALAAAVPVALGVAAIGLVNFLVSFGLSLATALESRRITWRELRTLIHHLSSRLLARPWEWFFPPRDTASGRRAERPHSRY